MQISDIQGYGHQGLKISLNIGDQYEITHMCERIENYVRNSKEIHAKTGEEFPMIEELEKVFNFLSKLAFPINEKCTVFDPKTDEEPVKVPVKAMK